MIQESLLIWAKNTTTISEYGTIPETTCATRTNEEKTSGATSFSSFPKSKNYWAITNIDEVNRRVMIFHMCYIIESHVI